MTRFGSNFQVLPDGFDFVPQTYRCNVFTHGVPLYPDVSPARVPAASQDDERFKRLVKEAVVEALTELLNEKN